MTFSINAPWKISQASGVVFNLLSGFIACISGFVVLIVGWISNNVNVPLSTTGRHCSNSISNNSHSNNAHASVPIISKWIWICTWMFIVCLLQVGFTEGVATPSEGNIKNLLHRPFQSQTET